MDCNCIGIPRVYFDKNFWIIHNAFGITTETNYAFFDRKFLLKIFNISLILVQFLFYYTKLFMYEK